jgi:hypothetical protein
MRNMEEECTGN